MYLDTDNGGGYQVLQSQDQRDVGAVELRCEWSPRHFKLNYRVRNWRPFGKQSISYFICVRDVLRLSLLDPWCFMINTICDIKFVSCLVITIYIPPLPPPPSLYGWLVDWLSLLRAPAYHLIDKLCDDSQSVSPVLLVLVCHARSPQHRAPLHQTIGQLLKVTKCWESFLLSSKKNISYDNGLILEAGKFLSDSLLFMPCLQFWTECSKWKILKRR